MLPSGMKRNPNPNPFEISRDALLDFYKEFDLPAEADSTLDCFVDECRLPLAHLPLSDIEKKLLSLVSINSEAGKRSQYPKPVKKQERRVKEVKNDDLWDTPVAAGPGTGLGSFGQDGVFGMKEENRLPVAQKNAWSVLAEDTGSNRASPVINSQAGFGVANLANNLQQFSFSPPQWVYEDPSRQVQGPFTSEQMHGWYKDGYFPPHLPIKCVGDPIYIPLIQFVEKFGQEAPFLVSLQEQEALEREFYLEGLRETRQPQPPPQSQFFADTGFKPRFNNPIGGPNPISPPNPDPQAFVNFMNQQKHLEQMAVVQPPSPVKQVVSPVAPKENSLYKQRITSPPPATENASLHPSNTKAGMVGSGPTSPLPVQKPVTPTSKPVQVPTTTLASPVSPIKKDKNKRQSESNESLDQEHSIVSPTQPHPIAVPKSKKPAAIAPWATKSEQTKPALKDIQEKEKTTKEKHDKLVQEKAQTRVIQEAKHIAEMEKVEKEPILAQGSQWASSTNLGSNNKKTLAQIMEDESKLKASDKSTVSSQPKGYAQSVQVAITAAPKASLKTAKAPSVVATGPLLKPSSSQDGWNVVTSKSSRPTSGGNAGANNRDVTTKQPTKLNYNGTAPSEVVGSAGVKSPTNSKPRVSESFSTWYRKALFPAARDSSLNGIYSLNS